MSWFKTNIVVALVALVMSLAVGACGYRPLYGQASANPQSLAALAAVDIRPIPDRHGQMMRTALKRRLAPQGAQAPLFVLNLNLQETKSGLGVAKSSFATRANLTLIGKYRLVRSADGVELLNGEARAVAGYNILDSEFSTLAAEADARKRSIETLADDIQTRLAIYFRNNPIPGSAK